MKSTVAACLLAALAMFAAFGAASAAPDAPAAAPLRVTLVTGPPTNVVTGSSWRLSVRVRRGSRAYVGPPPVVRGRGDAPLTVRLRRTARPGVFAASARFPVPGVWRLEAVVGGRRFPLGRFSVDVPVTELLQEPFVLTALSDGSFLVGQREGPLLRASGGKAEVFSQLQPVQSLSVTPAGIVLAAEGTRVHRLTTSGQPAAAPLTFAAEPAVAGDAQGALYVVFYENRVVRVDPSGAVTPFAGTGEEGFAGDGGPATSAKLFHPHDVAVGPDGAVYVADTENSRIRRIDPSTGLITSYGGDVGFPVSVDVAPDGTVYSAGVARGQAPGGVWRTTAAGSAIVARGTANSVSVGTDGTVYVCQWPEPRIAVLDVRTGGLRTILRGR